MNDSGGIGDEDDGWGDLLFFYGRLVHVLCIGQSDALACPIFCTNIRLSWRTRSIPIYCSRRFFPSIRFTCKMGCKKKKGKKVFVKRPRVVDTATVVITHAVRRPIQRAKSFYDRSDNACVNIYVRIIVCVHTPRYNNTKYARINNDKTSSDFTGSLH